MTVEISEKVQFFLSKYHGHRFWMNSTTVLQPAVLLQMFCNIFGINQERKIFTNVLAVVCKQRNTET